MSRLPPIPEAYMRPDGWQPPAPTRPKPPRPPAKVRPLLWRVLLILAVLCLGLVFIALYVPLRLIGAANAGLNLLEQYKKPRY
jgi:drug/metabolite transporter (DMT)-like permease